MTLVNKRILIFGGSGSLGNALVTKYIQENNIYVYSRDECKHWNMALKYNSTKLNFIIGDIRNKNRVRETLIRVKPNIIIIAAAIKHIDKCENATSECIMTNINGTQNVVDCVEELQYTLQGTVESICFISTDKACSPVNIYGMSKACSESIMIEKALHLPQFKFITVRYGNVLNSRGSIIPMLHEIGKSITQPYFKLTDERMTRFVMTLEQSVDLIEHAIIKGQSGDIVIPKLVSMNVKDLIELFSEKYNKTIKIVGIRPGEKILESLINETQAMKVIIDNDKYNIIKPYYVTVIDNIEIKDYNSKINPLSKEQLRNYLNEYNLLNGHSEFLNN